jgi:hypothetical protein
MQDCLGPGHPGHWQRAVLASVPGPNDIEFLRRISTILHRDDRSVPDLAETEQRHALVYVPSGGVDLSSAFRFAGLGCPEFHLLDRDIPPATQTRQQVAMMVNSRTKVPYGDYFETQPGELPTSCRGIRSQQFLCRDYGRRQRARAGCLRSDLCPPTSDFWLRLMAQHSGCRADDRRQIGRAGR